MNVDEKVGRNIRKYRMAYNMTLKELADEPMKTAIQFQPLSVSLILQESLLMN